MIDQPAKSEMQKAAEASVAEAQSELGPFVIAGKATRMAMVFTDAKQIGNPIIFANDSFLALTGYGRDEVLGQSFNFLLAHAADTEALAKIDAEFRGVSQGGAEIDYRRKDGSEFWAGLFISPVRDADRDIVQYFASFVDLTELKQEQTHARMLIAELNHRVKNTLATVQAIVWQALQSTDDIKTLRESIESRLFALSRSHDLLTAENWSSVRLVDLIDDALSPFTITGGRQDRIVIAGDDIRFPPRAALALSVAFNELATNAAKYGALSNAAGSVRVGWTILHSPAGDRVNLTWTETSGPPVHPPSRKGFGTRVIERGLTQELGCTVDLDYQSSGVICTMSIPVQGEWL